MACVRMACQLGTHGHELRKYLCTLQHRRRNRSREALFRRPGKEVFRNESCPLALVVALVVAVWEQALARAVWEQALAKELVPARGLGAKVVLVAP